MILSKPPALALIVPLLACSAFAQEFTWVGPAAGSWSVGNNWSGGSVPTTDSTVRIDGGSAQSSSVTLDVAAPIRTLEISAGDLLSINGGVTLAMSSVFTGKIIGPGEITVGNPLQSSTVSSLKGMELSGGGTMNLQRRSRLDGNAIINQLDYSVVGSGSIVAGGYALGTAGFVEARGAANGGSLSTLSVSVPLFQHRGLVSAAAGATLSIDSNLITSTGTIQAAAGGTVVFVGDVTLRGGTLSSPAGGLIVARPTEPPEQLNLENIVNAANFRSEQMQNTYTGNLLNTGTITLAATGGSLQMNGGSTSITGSGLIRLNDAFITGAATATIQQTSHAIRGYSTTGGIAVGTLINTGGLIETDAAGQRLALAQTTLLANSGTLSAVNGGELRLTGTAPLIDNRFGRIVARGAGSKVSIDHATRIFGGALETDEAGEIVFDAPAGTLTLDNVVNTGRLRLNSGTLAGGLTRSITNIGTITTSGTITLESTITLQGTGQFNANSRISYNGIINLSNRVGGSGEIESLDNRTDGIVDAMGTRLSLVSNTINSGLMRASGGGTLVIGKINNTGGRVEATAGSRVEIGGVAAGGTFAALAGGSFTGTSGFAEFGGNYTLLGPGTFGGQGPQTVPIRLPLTNGQVIDFGDNPVLDSATITLSGSATANLIGATRAVTFKDMAINVGAATLNLGPGTLNLQGSIISRANLNLLGTGTEAFRIFPVGVATLSGAGTIYNAGGGSGGGKLVNLDNTIYLNTASFGTWNGGWENYGALRGAGTASLLGIAPAQTVINRGEITSAATNRLDIVSSTSAGTFATIDNAAGRIAAGTNGVVALDHILIRTGTVDGTAGRITVTNTRTAELRDVMILGQGMDTGAGTLQTNSFINLPSGSMLTVGDANTDGGRLNPGFTTFYGGGSIRVLPLGDIVGAGRPTLDGVTLFGAGDVGNGLGAIIINSNAAVVSRVLPGIPGEPVMNLRAGYENIINNGMIAAEAGTRLNLIAGTPGFGRISGATGSINIQGGAIVSAQIFLATGRIVNDGTLSVLSGGATADVLEGTGRVYMEGGFLEVQQAHQTSLTMRGQSLVSLFGSAGVSRLNELSMEPLTRLNLFTGALVLDYDSVSPFAEIQALISSGYAGGAWNGRGIYSSSAQITPRRWGVGFAEATAVGSPATFMGEPVDSTSLLLRYTLYGDADLSGSVNLNDFTRLAASFGTASTWSSGDSNYDGVTNLDDFTALAANFGLSLPAEAARSAVPEPAAAGWALAITGLHRSARRRPSLHIKRSANSPT